jgi:hypothetical protein
MSGFMSNKFLKYRAPRPSEPVAICTDLPCAGCGYNLRGLTLGARCPECGRPMDVGPHVPDVLLRGDMAQKQRRRIALGVAAACLFGAGLLRCVLFVGLIELPWPNPSEGYIWLGLALSVAWVATVWALTPRDLVAVLGLPRGLRIMARYSQFLWIAGYVCWLISDTVLVGTPPGEQMYVAAILIRGVAGVGAIIFFILLMVMAAQSELEDAANRIHLALWMLPVPTLILIFIPSTIPWVAVILVGGPLVWWCWTLWMLGRSVWQMHGHVAWDLRLETDRPRRQERINEARQQFDQRIAANVRTVSPRPRGDLRIEE